jgi:pimeloyl-ACP methyl ester carboxylesterase
MAEQLLRRNLDDAFDPGPGFPDPLLLSRTMAALEPLERVPVRGQIRGSVRRRFSSLSPAASRMVAAALVVLVLITVFGALVVVGRLLVSPTPARWGACGGVFQCSTVKVPLDYSNPAAGSIEIATIRKPATDTAHRIGSLVLGPGGPGGSGVDYLRQNAVYYRSLNKRFDLVGFDQRGTGRSAPVRCLTNSEIDALYDVDTVLDDPGEKQIFVGANLALAQACQQTRGNLLPFVDTASAARDLDGIREALGDSRLTYLGYGYGSLLGENYAHLFPSHGRALVLDGVLDPAVGAMDVSIQRAAGFEDSLQAFLADCRALPGCALGKEGDPGARVAALMTRLDQRPIPVGSRMLGRRLAISALGPGLNPRYWRQLDTALAEAADGDGHAMLALADLDLGRRPDGSFSFSPEAWAAITCLDSQVPSDIAAYDRLGPAMAAASPLFGPAFQYGPLGCAYWPVKARVSAGPMAADGAPPILLVGATHDPTWPYAWAQHVNRQLAGSVLLTRDGYGTFSYFDSLCVQLAVDAYMTQTTLPAPGTVCESDYPVLPG